AARADGRRRPVGLPRVRDHGRSRRVDRAGPPRAGEQGARDLDLRLHRGRDVAARAPRRPARVQRHHAELRRRAGGLSACGHPAERRHRRRGRAMKTSHLIALAIAALAAVCSAGCEGRPQASADPPAVRARARDEPIVLSEEMRKAISVSPVTERVVARQLVVAGKVQFEEARSAHVLVPVAGQIAQLGVKVGDVVRKGTTLCVVNSREAAAAVGEHIESHKDLELAEKTAAMTEDLYQHDAASKMALQQSQSDLAKTRSRVARTEEALQELGIAEGADLSRFHGRVPVTAAIGGVVIERKVTEGQFVQADGTPIITIADPAAVWVIGDLFERDLPLVTLGQRAQVSTAAYPGHPFDGRVNYISSTIDPQTRSAKVRVAVANSSGELKAEMFATVPLDVANGERVVLVPSRALFIEDGRSYVYMEVGSGRYQRRAVEAAPGDGDDRRILSGLHAGDRVVVDGAILLRQEEEQRAS